MKAGDIIQGTLSKCCNTSVSAHNGHEKNGQFIPHHYTCNNCKKITAPYKKDMWVITDKLKYKPLSNV